MAVLNLSCSMLSVTALMVLCTSRTCSDDGAPSPILTGAGASRGRAAPPSASSASRPSPARFLHTLWRKRCMPMMSRGSQGLEASSGPMYIS